LHKLWQKYHPTRHGSDLLRAGPVRAADHLLAEKEGAGHGEAVTEEGKWRPSGQVPIRRTAAGDVGPAAAKASVRAGQHMTNPSISCFTGFSSI